MGSASRWLLVLLLVAPASAAHAAGKRALLVGINQYLPKQAPTPEPQVVVAKASRVAPKGRGTWINLDGALNDVDSMRELLVRRFGFRPDDVIVLRDGEATREAILTSFRRHLIDGARAGDQGLFFYAGHGSQVRNSKTDEPDGLDETIVPADSYQGTADIRDKELAALYNQALDRGVVLTVISDSCHSGSVARGLSRAEKHRSLPPDPTDVAEPPVPGPAPEDRGLLVLSAAQDYQTAGEMTGEQGDPHGAFSYALMQTLQVVPPGEPVDRLFLRLKARMQSQGRLQEPVVAGTPERRRGSLFGDPPTATSQAMVPVLRRIGTTVTLQAGSALGLRERCELAPADAGHAKARLRVTAVRGVSVSEAEVVEGDPEAVTSGDLFVVDRWVAGDEPIRLWIPRSSIPESKLASLARSLQPYRSSGALSWIDDPTQESPTHVVEWRSGTWILRSGNAGSTSLGPDLDPKTLMSRLNGGAERPRLYVQLPASEELAAALSLGPGTPNDIVELAESAGDAHYVLAGRAASDGSVEYAWVLPNVTQEDRGVVALPPRTDWTPTGADLARTLAESALRLSRIHGWLTLEAPPDDGAFPYRLALKNVATSEATTQGRLVAGETYAPVLQADPEALAAGVERRFVYVFTIDSYGTSNLLFPRPGRGNVENAIPYARQSPEGPPAEIPLGRIRFQVGPPFGTDVYLLLTSARPIPDPDVLHFEGVRTRGLRAGGEDSPLGRLLGGVGGASRGVVPQTPPDWSLERLVLTSGPAR